MKRVGSGGRADSKSQIRVWHWLPQRHLQQLSDVMHHRLHAGTDRLKPLQPQKVHRSCPQSGQRTSAVAAVPVRVFVELGVADPVPAFKAPAVSHQLQQGFWGGPQTGEEKVGGTEGLAVTRASGAYLHDPAGADPFRSDVLRRLFGPQRPGDLAAVALLVIRCHERDLALPLELAEDPAVQGLLVGLDGQEEVGPLLLELPKNISLPCRGSLWFYNTRGKAYSHLS